MRNKKMKSKIIFRLFFIAIISGLLIWGGIVIIQKGKSIKLNHQENKGYIQTLPPKTFSDIKQETLSFFIDQNSSAKINFAFIEFKRDDIKHALIIRMDSLVGIISIREPNLSKNNPDDQVIQESFELIKLLNQHFNSLSFGINQQKIPNLRMQGINVYIHPDGEAIMQLSIDQDNYQKPIYYEISERVAKLISEICLIEFSVEDLMKPIN